MGVDTELATKRLSIGEARRPCWTALTRNGATTLAATSSAGVGAGVVVIGIAAVVLVPSTAPVVLLGLTGGGAVVVLAGVVGRPAVVVLFPSGRSPIEYSPYHVAVNAPALGADGAPSSHLSGVLCIRAGARRSGWMGPLYIHRKGRGSEYAGLQHNFQGTPNRFMSQGVGSHAPGHRRGHPDCPR